MPNVFAEAARAGCYTVCSEIEAADEFIGFGRNGKKFPMGDANRLSDIFLKYAMNRLNLFLLKTLAQLRNMLIDITDMKQW